MFKKLVSVALAVVVCLSMTVSAFAYHFIPGQDDIPFDKKVKCNNTYYTMEHLNFAKRRQSGSHELTDGRTCNVFMESYKHVQTCTACKAVLGYPTMECTEAHELCGTYIPHCV